MATINIHGSRGFTSPDNADRYYPVGGYNVQDNTELNTQKTMRSAGTFSKLYTYVSANAAANNELRLRVNAGDGNQLLSIPTSTTGEFEDNSNTDAVSAGDEVNYDWGSSSGSGSTITFEVINVLFAADTNTVSLLSVSNTGNLTAASTTWFVTHSGAINTIGTTEAAVQDKARTAGTLKNFCVAVSTWSRSSDTTIRSRIGGSNGNMVMTINATGLFEDTSSTDSISVDDLFNYSITNGTGSGTYRNTGPLVAEFETTNTAWPMMHADGNQPTFSTSTTTYFAISGRNNNTTEANVDADANVAFTWSDLTVYVPTNGITATSELRSRIGGGDGNQVVSIGSGVTGLLEDTSNSDSVGADDEIDYDLTTGGSGTSLAVAFISSLGQISAAVSAPPMRTLFGVGT